MTQTPKHILDAQLDIEQMDWVYTEEGQKYFREHDPVYLQLRLTQRELFRLFDLIRYGEKISDDYKEQVLQAAKETKDLSGRARCSTRCILPSCIFKDQQGTAARRI